jgi:hypothetical protein
MIMINKIKNLIILLGLSFLFFCTRVHARLVPCGGSQDPCTWCHFGKLIENIIDFLMYLVFPLAVLMIVIGGILIMTSGGSSSRFSKGKEMITGAIIGILIALISWMIIDTIAGGWSGFNIIPWNKINFGC